MARILFAFVAVLGAAGHATAQQRAAPSQLAQALPLQGAMDWRQRVRKNHDPEQSIEQQVRRLTRDLELTPEQQEQVRQLSKKHSDRIQKILDTAPPTLTYNDFTAQVHAISQEYHDAVDALLTPHQLALMQAMVDRLDQGSEDRRAP
jgi:hypothetical protein